MNALDRDLRERILRAVDCGEPMTRVATLFEVRYSTVEKWKRRRRETGAAETSPRRCGRERALSPEQGDRLVALVAESARSRVIRRTPVRTLRFSRSTWLVQEGVGVRSAEVRIAFDAGYPGRRVPPLIARRFKPGAEVAYEDAGAFLVSL